MADLTPKVEPPSSEKRGIKLSDAIVVAVIGLVASLSSAVIIARWSVHDQVASSVQSVIDKRFPNLHLNDLREGTIEGARGGSCDNGRYRLNVVPPLLSKTTGDRGERLCIFHVTFEPPFTTDHPQILLALRTLDAESAHNLRVHLSSTRVSQKGADLVIQTWSDTQLNWVVVDWLAIQSEEGSLENTTPQSSRP